MGRLGDMIRRRVIKEAPAKDHDFKSLYRSNLLDHLPKSLQQRLRTALSKRGETPVAISEQDLETILATFDRIHGELVEELAKLHPLAIDLAALKIGAEANRFSVHEEFAAFNKLNATAQRLLINQSFAEHFLNYLYGSGGRDGLSLSALESLNRQGRLPLSYDFKRIFAQVARHKAMSAGALAFLFMAAPIVGQFNILWGNVRSSWDLVGEQTAAPVNAKLYSALAVKMHDLSQRAAARNEIERIFARALTDSEFQRLESQVGYRVVGLEYFERARNVPAYRIGSSLLADYVAQLNSYVVMTVELQIRMRFLAEEFLVVKSAMAIDPKASERLSLLEDQKRAILASYQAIPGQLAALVMARSYWLVGDQSESPAEVDAIRSALEMLLSPRAFDAEVQWSLAESLAGAKLHLGATPAVEDPKP